jgi:hypothetical protein
MREWIVRGRGEEGKRRLKGEKDEVTSSPGSRGLFTYLYSLTHSVVVKTKCIRICHQNQAMATSKYSDQLQNDSLGIKEVTLGYAGLLLCFYLIGEEGRGLPGAAGFDWEVSREVLVMIGYIML